MWEYLKPVAGDRGDSGGTAGPGRDEAPDPAASPPRDRIDRTRKHWIGGRQKRPDGGYSLTVTDPSGAPFAEVPRGNRKDVRNAVEAAARARGRWCGTNGHLRAQILYFVAENLAVRAEEFAGELIRSTGTDRAGARGRGGDRGADPLHLRRLGRQARWQGALHALPATSPSP